MSGGGVRASVRERSAPEALTSRPDLPQPQRSTRLAYQASSPQTEMISFAAARPVVAGRRAAPARAAPRAAVFGNARVLSQTVSASGRGVRAVVSMKVSLRPIQPVRLAPRRHHMDAADSLKRPAAAGRRPGLRRLRRCARRDRQGRWWWVLRPARRRSRGSCTLPTTADLPAERLAGPEKRQRGQNCCFLEILNYSSS